MNKPKYKYGDIVSFKVNVPCDEDELTRKDVIVSGKVYIVDAYGTFEQNKEPSYDIMVDNVEVTCIDGPCLFKHIRESEIL